MDAPTLGVTPTIAITYPPPSTTLLNGKVQVAGTVTGSVDTGVQVNNVRAYIYNGQFLTPPISIDSTTSTLNAQATTLDGLTATANVSVMASTGDPGATLATGASVGYAPLPVRLNLASTSAQSIQTVVVDFGDGTALYNGSGLGYVPLHTYAQPGIYVATATITFTSGPPQTAVTRIIAIALTEQRNSICSAYAYFRAQLIAGQVSNATRALTGTLSTRLTPFLQALNSGGSLSTTAAQLGMLATGTFTLDTADIVAVRDVSGQVIGYPVHFVKDVNGIWRLDSM
ncbi:MAG TPA: PKD domain-containing protein [Rudaea sp.]